MNKKGGLIDKPFMLLFFKMMIFVFVALAAVTLVNKYVSNSVDTMDVELELAAQSVILSPSELFFYDEELGIHYPGIVDATMLTKEKSGQVLGSFNQIFYYGDSDQSPPPFAFKVTLLDPQWIPFKLNGEELESVIYNQEWYEKWIPVSDTFFKGPGSTTKKVKRYYVMAMNEEGNVEDALLEITLVTPNV